MRKKPNQKSNLEELIIEYGSQNAACNDLKKYVSELNSKVKSAIHEAEKVNQDIIVDGWKCTLSVSDTSTMNEARLIEFAKKHGLDIVRTKECIDFDALESLIYKGELSRDLILELDCCKDVSKKEVLRCTKMKAE